MRGVFISFEGIDRCGKATQIIHVEEFLRRRGVPVTVGREPGGTAYGEAARRLVQDPHFIHRLNASYEEPLSVHEDLNAEAELFGYLLARSLFAERIVMPALQRGTVFIADRCGDSTLAYQGHGLYRGQREAVDFIARANAFAMRGLAPERTYLLDISAEESARRQGTWEFGAEKDRIEQRSDAFFARARQGYLALAAAEPERFVVVDGARTPEAIAQRIASDIWIFLERKGCLPRSLV